MKVLAVEDDRVALSILRRSLERLGHEVIEARDGEEAWAAWLKEKPRVAVSDWQMPKLDGLRLCKRFRAQEGQDYVYFILLTGTPPRRRAWTTSLRSRSTCRRSGCGCASPSGS
jgi:CheY-like chemotaxis protein